MNIRYQKTNLCLRCNGKTVLVLCDTLQSIDSLTSKCYTKHELLKSILKNDIISDYQLKIYLSNILNDLQDTYLLDDECQTFEFYLTTRDTMDSVSSNIVLPVLYGSGEITPSKIFAKVTQNEIYVGDILKLYSKQYESDNNNSLQIVDIQRIQASLLKENWINELPFYGELQKKVDSKVILPQDTYKYYLKLRQTANDFNKRNSMLSSLIKSLCNKSYYKSRSLYLIAQLCNEELSKFNSNIASSQIAEEDLFVTNIYKK